MCCLYIQQGDTVVFETLEASAGQVGPDSTSEVVGHLNFDLIHPLEPCLTQIHSYGILYPHSYRAASSMAEQGTLNAKVQGSSPWQPTSA